VRRGIARRLTPLVLVVAVLAGCTGEPSPTTTPLTFEPYTPTATPTPTPEPDPDDATVPPERPDLSQVDAETAEALAVYFLQLYPYVFATGDLAEWDAISHPECVYCASVRSGVEEMHAAGQRMEGGHSDLDEVVTTQVSDAMWQVDAVLIERESRTIDASDTVIATAAGPKAYDSTVVLVHENGRWLVRGAEFEARP